MASVAAPRMRHLSLAPLCASSALRSRLGLNVLHLTLFALLGLLPFAARAEFYAHYTKSPESITAPLGDEVAFFCQTNSQAEKVVWRHRPSGSPPDGGWRDLPSDCWTFTKPTLSKLTVHLKNESQAGEYRCVSWFWASALASVAAQLKVAQLAEAPVLPDRVLNVAPGANVLIRCPPPTPSEPPPTMLYYLLKGGEPIIANGDEFAGALVVRAGQADRTSVYTCAASNDFTGDVQEYNHRITVRAKEGPPSPPEFTEDMLQSVVGAEGTAVVLACGVIGRPAPKVLWKRNGGKSIPDRAVERLNMLHIVNVQMRDEGTYTCVAENSVGHAERSVSLSVWRAPSLDGDEATSVGGEDGAAITAGEGGEFKLPCGDSRGKPEPELHWLINGEEVTKDANIKIFGSELEINPVEKRHAGMVQCFATNALGTSSGTSLLRVIPRQVSAQGGGIETPIEAVGGSSGYKPGGKTTTRRRPHKSEMVPPTQPNVTRLSDNSVMVRWAVHQNSGLTILFFKVQYRETPQGKGGGRSRPGWMTTNHEIPPHVRSYEVDGLQPDHYYKFRIAAVYSNNDNNYGANSDKFLLQRGSGLPRAPPAPQLTHAEAVSSTDIRLHWELPMNTSKETAVEGFYVYYRPATSAGEYAKAAVEGGDARSLLVAHLAPGALYELKLQSFAPAAASDFSAIITQRTMKAPTVEKVPEVKFGGGLSKDPDDESGPSFGSSTSVGAGSDGGANSGGDRILTFAGVAVAGALLLFAVGGVIFYLKRRKDCAPGKQDGSNAAGGGGNAGSGGVERAGNDETSNGFLPSMAVSLPPHGHGHSHQLLTASPSPAKPPITITANPMHPEDENVDMELSYLSAQNNNCSSSPSRSPRAEPVSCRQQLRKQSPLRQSPLPRHISVREKYV